MARRARISTYFEFWLVQKNSVVELEKDDFDLSKHRRLQVRTGSCMIGALVHRNSSRRLLIQF